MLESTSNKRSPLRTLFIAFVLTLSLVFSIFAYYIWQQVWRESRAELNHFNQQVVQTTDQTLIRYESLLRLVGESLYAMDIIRHPENGRDLLEQSLLVTPAMAGFGIARNDGQLVLVSGIETGVALPNLLQYDRSRASFLQALESKRMIAGRTYFMELLEHWVIPIRLTIGNGQSTPFVMTAGFDINAKEVPWNKINLPPGLEIRLLRPDGYWQFIKPLQHEQKKSSYGAQVSDKTLAAITTPDPATETPEIEGASVFHLDGRYCISSYMPRWQLYSMVSIGASEITARFIERMLFPAIFYLTLLLFGGVIYTLQRKQQQRYETKLIYQAHYDHLTNLPNRVLVHERLRQAVSLARRDKQIVAVAFLDLDNFKRVNDTFGHMVGDELLKLCADRLTELLRESDTVSRLSGDEFLLIFPHISTAGSVETIAHAIQKAFDFPFRIRNHEIYTSCSIGIALYPTDAETSDELLQAADTALYEAKSSGRMTHRFYSAKMNQAVERRMQLETGLRSALKRSEISLVYQPQIDLNSGRWIGCEALVRWNSTELGQVSPDEFIPVAEETGLIRKLGQFVIEQAGKDLADLLVHTDSPLSMSINLSPRELYEIGLVSHITGILTKYDLPPTLIELEITESGMVESGDQLQRLRELGISIAIDDFGTGFSSLSYLQRFPITTLKIDRCFLADLETDKQAALLVKSIVTLGLSLNLRIIAEGIETESQLEFMKNTGCSIGQGYLFSEPLPLSEFKDQLIKNHREQQSTRR